MAAIRVYADTSVFGGVRDTEFGEASHQFFEQVRFGRFQLHVSDTVDAEISTAPPEVRELYDEMLPSATVVAVSLEAIALRDAYLAAGIVTARSSDDALHVALATVSGCAIIVSWNFRHIVHFQKIAAYNEANVRNGYSRIAIHSPAEVIEYEEKDL